MQIFKNKLIIRDINKKSGYTLHKQPLTISDDSEGFNSFIIVFYYLRDKMMDMFILLIF